MTRTDFGSQVPGAGLQLLRAVEEGAEGVAVGGIRLLARLRHPVRRHRAAAVACLRGGDVPAYLTRRPDLADEVEGGLDAFLRVRFALQAGYFAWRCSNNIMTGITDPAENLIGLADARHALIGGGATSAGDQR